MRCSILFVLITLGSSVLVERGLEPEDAHAALQEQQVSSIVRHESKSNANPKTGGSEQIHPQPRMIGVWVGAFVFLCLCITFMFHSMGASFIFQVVLYSASLGSIKIVLKLVYVQDFQYPKFITAMHLLFSTIAAFVVLLVRWQQTGKKPAVPTVREWAFAIVPIALAFGFSIASENMALVLVSAAFAEIIASLGPVVSAFLTRVFGMPVNFKVLAPITVVIVGCAVSATGEMHYSGYGTVLLFVSVILRAFKGVMQQKLLTGETRDKFDPVTLMCWTCLVSFFELLIYSAATEHEAPFKMFATKFRQAGFAAAFLASCVVAITLNISGLFVTKGLGAVGIMMVAQMKAILVVAGGVAFLGEKFTGRQTRGFVVILVGMYWYSWVQRNGVLLPIWAEKKSAEDLLPPVDASQSPNNAKPAEDEEPDTTAEDEEPKMRNQPMTNAKVL